MTAYPRIIVIYPFRWGPRGCPFDPVIVSFANGLREGGFSIGRNACLNIVTASEIGTLRAQVLAQLTRPADLIYACGSSAMQIALDARVSLGVYPPILYRGVHPKHAGCSLNPIPDVSGLGGIKATIPLLEDRRQFRVLRELFPNLETIYGLFAGPGTFFDLNRSEKRQDVLVSTWTASARCGRFPGLGKMAALIEAQFYELVYPDMEALQANLKDLPRGGFNGRLGSVRAILLSCVDCHHVAGAADVIPRMCQDASVPFISLSHLDFSGRAGPLFSFENDWVEPSWFLGKWAADLLGGCRVLHGNEVIQRDRFQVRYYASHSASLGLKLPPALLKRLQMTFGSIIIDSQTSQWDFSPAESLHPEVILDEF